MLVVGCHRSLGLCTLGEHAQIHRPGFGCERLVVGTLAYWEQTYPE